MCLVLDEVLIGILGGILSRMGIGKDGEILSWITAGVWVTESSWEVFEVK